MGGIYRRAGRKNKRPPGETAPARGGFGPSAQPPPQTPLETYYRPEHLPRFGEIAEGSRPLADAFFAYYGKVFEDGALTAREKALIALAVAHTVQCPYCIDAYTQESLAKGADLEQMTEAVHVACAIRGGASLVHGLQMMDHARAQLM
jgi:4-carboxymuconolactone decarboxylase